MLVYVNELRCHAHGILAPSSHEYAIQKCSKKKNVVKKLFFQGNKAGNILKTKSNLSLFIDE